MNGSINAGEPKKIAQIAQAMSDLEEEVRLMGDAVATVGDKTSVVQFINPSKPVETSKDGSKETEMAPLAQAIINQVGLLRNVRISLNGIISRIEL